MNSGSKSGRWRRRRWWLTIGFFFVLQLLLLMLLSERKAPTKPIAKRTNVKLLTQPFSENETLSSLVASDPSVFVIANARGFSGDAWLNLKPQTYSISDWNEPSQWLEVNVSRLGEVFTNFLRGIPENGLQIAEKITVQPLVLEDGPKPPTASRLTLEGDVRNRLLKPIQSLPVWSTSDVLRDSVVEISVDGAGDVVFTRLLSRSGLMLADQRAITAARELRFKPLNNGAGATGLSIGKVIFHWETVPAPTSSEFE